MTDFRFILHLRPNWLKIYIRCARSKIFYGNSIHFVLALVFKKIMWSSEERYFKQHSVVGNYLGWFLDGFKMRLKVEEL